MADEIKVPIVTSYDDAAAKKALTDADKIEAADPEVHITADDDASKKLEQVSDETKALDRQDAEVVARAKVDAAKAELKELQRQLADIDGTTVTPKVSADTSQAKAGLGELGDLAGEIPGPLGEAAGLLAGGGGIAAGAGLAATALYGVMDAAANAALEAQSLASLTGASVEEASRLQAIWKQTGADQNDLADSILNMNGVLADSPEIAKRFGVNLEDGRDGVARMVELIQKINDSTLSANDKARVLGQLFGEEGVRQVQALTTLVGTDLQAALDDVSDTQVISDEDVRQAREFKQMVADIKGAVQGAALSVGRDLIPMLNDARTIVGDINGLLGDLSGDKVSLGDVLGPFSIFTPQGAALKGIGFLRDQIKGSGEDSKLVKNTLDGIGDSIAEIVTKEIEHAQAIEATTGSREAANREMEEYVAWLTQRGDEAAAEKQVTDETKRHYDQLARVNTEAERVDRARLLRQERDAVDDVTDAYKEMHDELSDRRSLLTLQQGFDDVRASAEEAWIAAAEGAEDAEEKSRSYQIEQIDQINNALEYIKTVEGIPDKAVTDIQALIDQGKYNEALTALEILSRPRSVELTAHINELALQRQLANFYARSGLNPITGPRSLPPAGGGGPVVTPFAAATGNTIVNVNMPRGSRGVDVLRQVSGQARRSGRRYGTPVLHYARRAG